MHPRAAQLIADLHLTPHPEGGYFREIHRSQALVRPGDGRADRSALTVIYFLLVAGEVSRWHRVASDEAWHFHEGDPLELLRADAGFEQVDRQLLGSHEANQQPVCIVPAGAWQAARCTGAYTLVSCSVGPGFDFADFVMLRERPEDSAVLVRRHPHLVSLV